MVGIAFGLAALCGARRWMRVIAGVVALVGFVVLVTPEPSVVRAAAMALISMLALLLGRTGSGVTTLCLAVAVLLMIDPWLCRELGFALSVAATGALLVLAAPLARALRIWMPAPLALALAVPLSAQLACAPILALITPVVGVYGVVANLLAAPAAAPVTVLGLLACLAAPIPVLQAGLAALAWVPAAWIASVAAVTTSLPGADLEWWEGIEGLAIVGALCAACVVLLVRAGAGSRLSQRLIAGGLVAGAAVLVGVVVTDVVVRRGVPQDWALALCDVGQGDSVLLRESGQTMIVDTGEEPKALERCLRTLEVDRVDVMVLTHFDVDHVGAASVLAGRVGLLLHGPPETAKDRGVVDGVRADRVEQVTAGAQGMLGEAPWRVRWPRTATEPPGNDASVVIDIGGGSLPSTLLLGDLGATAQRRMAAAGGLREHYEVVKVAHHGSADQAATLYERIAARVALIGVGADNSYGHPTASILTVLEGTSSRVLRSDTDGLALVIPVEGGLRIWRERPE